MPSDDAHNWHMCRAAMQGWWGNRKNYRARLQPPERGLLQGIIPWLLSMNCKVQFTIITDRLHSCNPTWNCHMQKIPCCAATAASVTKTGWTKWPCSTLNQDTQAWPPAAVAPTQCPVTGPLEATQPQHMHGAVMVLSATALYLHYRVRTHKLV